MVNKKTSLVPGNSYCILVRGTATGGAFTDQYCKRFYMIRLMNAVGPYNITLHAFSITQNAVLVFTTATSRFGLHEMLIKVGESYTQYFQDRFERRTNPLNPTVLRSHVAGDRLSLDCQKFIERRPVDLAACSDAGEYEFSSYPVNGFGCGSTTIIKHSSFSQFLEARNSSLRNYRDFVGKKFDDRYLSYVQTKIESGQPLAKNCKELDRVKINKRPARLAKRHPILI